MGTGIALIATLYCEFGNENFNAQENEDFEFKNKSSSYWPWQNW